MSDLFFYISRNPQSFIPGAKRTEEHIQSHRMEIERWMDSLEKGERRLGAVDQTLVESLSNAIVSYDIVCQFRALQCGD